MECLLSRTTRMAAKVTARLIPTIDPSRDALHVLVFTRSVLTRPDQATMRVKAVSVRKALVPTSSRTLPSSAAISLAVVISPVSKAVINRVSRVATSLVSREVIVLTIIIMKKGTSPVSKEVIVPVIITMMVSSSRATRLAVVISLAVVMASSVAVMASLVVMLSSVAAMVSPVVMLSSVVAMFSPVVATASRNAAVMVSSAAAMILMPSIP